MVGRRTDRETHTQTLNTKSRDGKLQEELTGFDVEGQPIGAIRVGGIADSGDVRRDLDTDHTLNALLSLLSLLFRCRLQDLAQRKNT